MEISPEDEVRQALKRAGVTLTENDQPAVVAMASAWPRGRHPQSATEPALVHLPARWEAK